MNFIVGKDWRDLFDIVIVQADKPGFFNDRRKWVPGNAANNSNVIASLWISQVKVKENFVIQPGNRVCKETNEIAFL